MISWMKFNNDNEKFYYFIQRFALSRALENYSFEQFGWERSDDGPYLGMGAQPETGARTAVPVKRLTR